MSSYLSIAEQNSFKVHSTVYCVDWAFFTDK